MICFHFFTFKAHFCYFSSILPETEINESNNIKVKIDAKVNKTRQLATMNRQMIIQKQKNPTIFIAFTNIKILTKIPEITKAYVKLGQFFTAKKLL